MVLPAARVLTGAANGTRQLFNPFSFLLSFAFFNQTPYHLLHQQQSPMSLLPDSSCFTVSTTYQTAAEITAALVKHLFVAPRACQVTAIQCLAVTLETTSAILTIDVVKCTGTTAISSGTTMLANTFNAKAATGTSPLVANTVVNGNLSATPANLQLAAGDRIGVLLGDTSTQLLKLTVMVTYKFI